MIDFKPLLMILVTLGLITACSKPPTRNSVYIEAPEETTLNMRAEVSLEINHSDMFAGESSGSESFKKGLADFISYKAPNIIDVPIVNCFENCFKITVNSKRYFSQPSATITISSAPNKEPEVINVAMESQITGMYSTNDNITAIHNEAYNFGVVVGEKLLGSLFENSDFMEVVAHHNADEAKRLAEKTKRESPENSNNAANSLYVHKVRDTQTNQISASIDAYHSAISEGYKPTHLPTFGTSLIVLDESRIGLFPIGSSDLPLKPILLKRKEITGVLNKTEKAILVQLISSTVQRDIISQSKVQSEYISGHSERPNPAYDTARRDYQRALNDYNRIQADISSQSSAGSLWWAQTLSNAALIATASNALNNAKQRLAQIPQTTSIPIKQDYSYNAMQVKVSKDVSYNLYIIDLVTNKVFFKKYNKSGDKTFTLHYDKHSEDPWSRTHDDESDVETYEKQALTFSVDDIVDDLVATTSKEFKSKPYTKSLSFIKTPKAKKRTAVAQKPKAVNGKLGGLMQSVVAIQDNGGRTIGTGFFINDNLILTNRHVVDERKLISIRTKGGQKYVGKVLDAHYDLDIALVEIDGTGTPVKMYSGSSASEGEEVIAIGNPMGLEYSVTKGIISSIRKRKDKKKPLSKEYAYIQTDVPINPGNSGGPLFMNGKVVGINTMKLVDEDIEGIGFAIHYDEILKYLDDNGVHLVRDKAKPIVKHVVLAKKSTVSQEDAAERKLTRLKKMFDKGLITEDEYEKERSEVLEKF